MMSTSTTYLPNTIPFNDEELIFNLRSESIKDTFEMEKKLELVTHSGSIKAKVMLHAKSQSLVIASQSGSIQAEIIGRPMGNLISEHSAHSGSQKLTYPAEWRGTIELTLDSGSYKFTGDESNTKVLRDIRQSKKEQRVVVVVRPKNGTAYEEGCSLIRVHTGSGSVEIKFDGKDTTEDAPAPEKQARRPWMAVLIEREAPAGLSRTSTAEPVVYVEPGYMRRNTVEPPPYHEDAAELKMERW